MAWNTVSQEPVEIFISYSRKDRHYAEELEKHLKIYQLNGRIRVWYDGNLSPGEDWENEIYQHFCCAKVILLLVSPDFFSSDYCTRLEMPAALQRHANTDAIVVPVIIRRVAWQRTALAKLMVLPKCGKPVDDWENEDKYFENVTTSLFEKLDELLGDDGSRGQNPWNPTPTPVVDESPPPPPPPGPKPRAKSRPARTSSQTANSERTSTTDVPVPPSELHEEAPPADGTSAGSAAPIRIVVCFAHPERRHKLRNLRKWCRDSRDSLFPDQTIKVLESRGLDDAVQRLDREPESTVLLFDGFTPGAPELDEALQLKRRQNLFNVIINDWNQTAARVTSASILQPQYTITSDEQLFGTLQTVASKMLELRAREVTPHTFASADKPDDFCSSVRSTVLKIVVCFVHPERRHKLRNLRQWCRDSQDPLIPHQTIKIVESRDIEDAVRRLSEAPDTTVLLMEGFEPGAPQLDEVLRTTQARNLFNVIINCPEWNKVTVQEASASIFRPRHTVTSDETLYSTLHKTLLRVRTRLFASARVLVDKEELAAFFELRYRVWSELDYLPEKKKCPGTPWELDYTDRTSVPLGIFSKRDGRLLGGARLVRGFGRDYPELIRTVTEMLEERRADNLKKNFQYPTSVTHPYDILGELNRFQDYYRRLVLRRISKAEVSRVVVDPGFRKLGLGEVTVDTLCSLAKVHSIRVLFLACHVKHADFYQRSHFNPVDGVAGDHFLSYRVACIAMEREL